MKTAFEKFNFKSLGELKEKIKELNLDIPVSEDVSSLKCDAKIGDRALKNLLCVHPMEGCDSKEDGSPSDLVYRRYERFAKGGSGLLWVEACAVNEGGRANPRQLYIHEGNVDEFKNLVEFTRSKAEGEVYLVLQLTHAGRYAKPGKGLPAVIAGENEYLDRFLPQNVHTITDDELSDLENQFVNAALLAQRAGFDAVDIKSCHRYLCNELLASYNRKGKYGGSFENRTRFLFNIVKKVKEKADIDVTVRLNAFDEIPYPHGFGVDKSDYKIPDLTETKKIVSTLYELGVKLINITGGNPYYNPHVNRPYDVGFYTPVSHPLENVRKLLNAARQIKKAVPDMRVIATGLTWLREYSANVAAGCINDGWFDFVGFGRQAFAYPDFANDIVNSGGMQRGKCCIACGKCTEIMRDGGTTGCVIRDSKLYLPIYTEGRQGKQKITGTRVGESI
ncbi:MAG: NADH:flavin oxidoreductase [Firmicutes bacterium]|nr:NADH:flavin oxidoreductase [Bacillota bacterium]